MRDILLVALVILLFGGTATFGNWLAWKVWHDPGSFEGAVALAQGRLDRRTARSVARGLAAVAIYFDWLFAVMVFDLALPVIPHTAAWETVAAIIVAGLIVWPLVILWVTAFNRPKFLIVPYQRHLTRADLREDTPQAHRQAGDLDTPRRFSKGRRRRHIAGRNRPRRG